MIIQTKTRKAHYYNEDRIFIGENYFMVMDGATPLLKSGIKPTEASWFVSYIKKNLPKNCQNVVEKLNNISINAVETLKSYNFEINEKYMPSTGLAWIELKNDYIVAHTIGDCEVTARLKNGQIVRVYQTELLKLDNIAVKELVKQAKVNNICVKQARKYIQDILIKHRSYMNKENGYNVFTPSPNPNFKFSKKQFKICDVEEMYIYTDGLSQAFDELKIYNDHKEMFKTSLDLNKEIEKIVKTAFSDKDCNTFPRFKTIDDIAVIKITF